MLLASAQRNHEAFLSFPAANPMAGDPESTEYSSSKPVKARRGTILHRRR